MADLSGVVRRTRGPSTAKTTATRATLVAAAREVFLKRGYSGCRIRDVARRARVAPGTVYRYFDTKDALFEEVFREAIAEPLAAVRAAVATDDGDIGSALRELLLPLAREFRDGYRSAIFRVVVAESVRFPALAETYRRAIVLPMVGQVRAMASEAVARGQMRTDVLVRFPELLVAPLLVAALKDVFSATSEVDIEAMLEAHLNALFPSDQNRMVIGEGGMGVPPGRSV